jgi:hypothetical protein
MAKTAAHHNIGLPIEVIAEVHLAAPHETLEE